MYCWLLLQIYPSNLRFVLQGHISKMRVVRASTVVHVGQNMRAKNITDIGVRMRLVFSEDHRVITEVL